MSVIRKLLKILNFSKVEVSKQIMVQSGQLLFKPEVE